MSIVARSVWAAAERNHRQLSIVTAATLLGSCLGLCWTSAEDNRPRVPSLQLPVTDSAPVIDGKLDEPCWEEAARTGPLKAAPTGADSSSTEAFFLSGTEHLYVGVVCAANDEAEGMDLAQTSAFTPGRIAGHGKSEYGSFLSAHWAGKPRPLEPAKEVEFVELLIDSNNDRNSYYLIRISLENGGKLTCSYNEHDPPWHDRTWQPQFKSAVAQGEGGWSAEFALPWEIFNKNKTVSPEMGFNVRRAGMPGPVIHYWQGPFAHPDEAAILTGIPDGIRVSTPDYVKPELYAPPTQDQRSFLAERARQTIELGPGSTHPGTTGEVMLEFEEFLLAGDPHAAGIIWDIVVDERKGELYVLSDGRPARGVPDLRVFDRQGKYLRTLMPFNPNLARASIQDLCESMVREGDAELGAAKLFETICGELSIYGAFWNLPQKMAMAPDGDLILSNIYRGTLWRMSPDGGLPLEGWTSIYHRGRNEPFESTDWTQSALLVQDLKNYMPFRSLRYPYFGFDPGGSLYITAGQSSRPTRLYGYHWEISEQQASYHWALSDEEQRGNNVWKVQVGPGPRLEKQMAFDGFLEPSGLILDDNHLIVADAGNNRLRVLGADGQVVASITHYQRDGREEPLHGPTALATDHEKNLYVLVGEEPRPQDEHVERTMPLLQRARYEDLAARKPPGAARLIKLQSWSEPRLLAVSAPLHPDVLQIAVDGGVSPPLVWVANGTGPGSLLQLDGNDLSIRAEYGDSENSLRFPRQSGHLPILNIDRHTGHLYVEDESNHRLKQYGTVYRLDQEGNVLKKWPPLFFDARGRNVTSPWGSLNFERHFRYPDEPLFIDSIFGKDGRVYRWKVGKDGVEILRFDREGIPVPFAATGTNGLFVDYPVQTDFWHDVYQGMDVDRDGNIYFVAKADVDAAARPVSAYTRTRRQVNMYDVDGNLKTRGLLRLDAVRSIQIDDEGGIYILHRPAARSGEAALALSKFPASGGEPLWSRRWDGYVGAEVMFPPCQCITSRQHQTLDGKGYLYAAGKYSVQVIDTTTGKLVGEFGSYGNMDCQGKGSQFPHPELPFGTISALSVWQDRLFVVDVLNRRIVKCRIVYGEAEDQGP